MAAVVAAHLGLAGGVWRRLTPRSPRNVLYLGREGGGQGTVMRHFLSAALTVGILTLGMAHGAHARALVASAGTAQGLLAPDTGTRSRAVDVAAVATGADADLGLAASAVVEPETLVAQDPPDKEGWTRTAGSWTLGMVVTLYDGLGGSGAQSPGLHPLGTKTISRGCGQATWSS